MFINILMIQSYGNILKRLMLLDAIDAMNKVETDYAKKSFKLKDNIKKRILKK